MSGIKYYNEEGLKKIKADLHRMMTVDRPDASKQIAEARDKGDLSENAEYDAAKEAQGMLEMKISKLQDTIRNARIIDESKLDTSKVLILSHVTLRNLKNNAMMKYCIVPESEADLKNSRLSVNSPIAKGLLGKRTGDVAEIQVPAGLISFEIVEVAR